MRTLYDAIRGWSKRKPNSLAVIDENQTYTYSTLWKTVDTFCNFLEIAGSKSGDTVVIALPKSIDWFCWFAACVSRNIIVVPFRQFCEAGISYETLHRLGATFIIYPANMHATIGYDFDYIFEIPSKLPSLFSRCAPGTQTTPLRYTLARYCEAHKGVVYLNPTSGSTGRPKYAVTTNDNLYWNTLSAITGLSLSSSDIHMCLFPAHMHPHEFIFRPIFLGGTAVIISIFNPELIIKLARRHRVSLLMATPTQLIHLIDYLRSNKLPPLDSLRLIESGGDVSPPALIEAAPGTLGNQFISVWGSTETTGIVFSTIDIAPKPRLLGRPHKHYNVTIDHYSQPENEYGKQLESISEGEMVIQGPGVVHLHLCENGTSQHIDKRYSTGDIVRRDNEGLFWFIGRSDRIISVAGEKVAAAEIEAAICSHPLVVYCVVVARKHSTKGQTPYAFVTTTEPEAITEKELRNFCYKLLPPHKIPKHIKFLLTFPTIGSGKVDLRKLQQMVESEERG